MTAQFSTDDVSGKERYDYWQHMHQEIFGLDFRFLTGRPEWFRGHCAISELGGMRTAVISVGGGAATTAGEVRSSPAFSGQMDAYEIKFSLACEHFVLTQDGRQTDLRSGDFALIDLTRPASARAIGHRPKRAVSLLLPRTQLPLTPKQVARLTAVRMSGRDGTGALVSALLRRIATDVDTYDPAAAARVSTAVLDLVAATLAGRLDLQPTKPNERSAALLRLIYTFIDRHLGEPGLSPDQVAAAHHISKRQLYKLFETEDHTIAEWIRRRRLDRCRRDLADPALADRPVSAIAARWGFTDATHFNRSFRAVHGAPPGEYRQLRLGVQIGGRVHPGGDAGPDAEQPDHH